MKRALYLLYSLLLVAIGAWLYLDLPENGARPNLFYLLNIQLLILFGIRGFFFRQKKKAIVYEHQIIIKDGKKNVERLDLRKALKLSPQINRLTLFYDGYVRHLVYRDFTTSSQRALKTLARL